MKNIALYNHKGGVGKTTSVINIAYFLQKSAKTVLVVDCDSQRNSFGFFSFQNISSEIHQTKYKNISLTTYENISQNIKTAEDFDFCLFDLPPAMTDEVKGIIRISDFVFIPTILGEFKISGLQDVTEEIKKNDTKLGGIFITMFCKENDKEILLEFEGVLKNRLMDTVIPYSKTVRESQKVGLSLEEYFDSKKVPKAPISRKVAFAYENLTNEILKRSEENA